MFRICLEVVSDLTSVPKVNFGCQNLRFRFVNLEILKDLPFWGPVNLEILKDEPFWGPVNLEFLKDQPFWGLVNLEILGKLMNHCENLWFWKYWVSQSAQSAAGKYKYPSPPRGRPHAVHYTNRPPKGMEVRIFIELIELFLILANSLQTIKVYIWEMSREYWRIV